MAHEHSHGAGANEKALRWALLLTSTYLVAEVVGGLVSGSLALLSDAAHMFTDTVALAISLAAIRIGRRPADRSAGQKYCFIFRPAGGSGREKTNFLKKQCVL